MIFAGVFGSSQGDEKYNARYDLNGDGEIGFSDFVIFAQNFGKEVPSDDRAALVALYEATDGPNWTNKENWLSTAPLGEWYGVTTDSNGRVTRLSLNENNLQGTIPAELGQLTNLTVLYLHDNQLTGTIPTELARLSKLTSLDLSTNQLTGAIPVELGNLENLTGLVLAENQLSGAIPVELGNLENLEWLVLAENQLSGAIPVELGNLENLTGLVLAKNQLSGAIPVELGNLENLTRLWLAKNQLSGAIPVELGNLTNLTSLWLNANQLSGAIPTELGQLTNLTVLWLNANQLTGTIPTELGQLTKLTWLDLGWNPLSGTIPVELGQLINLTELSLTKNQLTGKIPNELGQLTNLTVLALGGNKFTDISSLEGLTNLNELYLWSNDIIDISSLEGLTNLNELYLFSNDIIDISTLAGLTNLSKLQLADNNITDISLLANLTNLTHLSVAYNNFTDTDVSALTGLIYLVELDLRFNGITDISALAGLASLERLNLRGNPLSDVSIAEHVSALENMGVTVVFDSFRKGDFDIELIFVGSFAEKHRNMLQYVARRWMAVIVEDLPDYELTQGWSGTCGDHTYEIPAGERIDDLRIYVTTFVEDDYPDAVGWGGPDLLRDETHLPVLGCMGFDLERADLEITGLHEAGHVLGFGAVWEDFGLIQDLSWDDVNADTHFNGPLAIAAFNEAGGRDYTGAKVPVEKMDGSHWRSPAIDFELMSPPGGAYLSAITVQSFADLGYGVDVSQADAYTLPGASAGKVSAKIAVAMPSIPGYDIDHTQADAYALPGVGPHWQGRISDGPSSIFGDGRWRGRLESAERVWGRGMNFDLPDDPQMWLVGPPTQSEPKLKCGVELRREPIYVVDPQGRVVRTIGH